MSDPWNDIQSAKDRKNMLRAKMLQRKREREGLVAELIGETSAGASSSSAPRTATGMTILYTCIHEFEA